jgi:hypothetical protein
MEKIVFSFVFLALAGSAGRGILAADTKCCAGEGSGRLEKISAVQPSAGWIELFNGRDLEGWVQCGGKAIYRAEGGELVGVVVPKTPNAFLCTERSFTNFVLELEFKPSTGLNSGVQIRSESFDQPKVVVSGGREIKIPAGRVHGYQVEIDPTSRAWTGGIYDEGRRGWLRDLKDNEPARKTFKPDAWNHLRVECLGDSIKTWLNGVLAAELEDSMTPAGFIGLQVHGIGEKTAHLEIRWRNIRLKEFP